MRIAAAAVAMAIVLAGCGSSGDSVDVGPSASATPSPAASPQSDGARPKDVRSDAGAIDFSGFAIRTIVATTGGADVDDFLSLSTPACVGCIGLAKEIGKSPDTVQKLDSPPTISDASVIKQDGEDYVVEQTVAMPGGKKIDTSDDSVISSFDAITYRFVVRATWAKTRWTLADYSVEKTS